MNKRSRAEIIAAELRKTNDRLAELQTEFDSLNARATAVEKDYIAKHVDFAEHQIAQNSLSAMERTINTLLATAGRLEADRKDALETETRQACFDRLKTIASDARSEFDSYLSLRIDLDKVLQTAVAANFRFRDKQAEFVDCVRSFLPGIQRFNPGAAPKGQHLEFAQLLNEIKKIGISDQDLSLVAAAYPEHPALECSQGVDAAIDAEISHRSRERYEQRQRKADEARAANAERRTAEADERRKTQEKVKEQQQKWRPAFQSA
ncbi:MAG TPA: hypothetical protein VL325_06140 [Pyrinomonadaceae bacterium]|jgi:hypothetical protein|nr:hypothetical protein [Pyrinomonadaceae bacterium]